MALTRPKRTSLSVSEGDEIDGCAGAMTGPWETLPGGIIKERVFCSGGLGALLLARTAAMGN